MSLDFLKQMHDQSVAKEGQPTHPSPGKIIEGRKFRVNCIYEPEFADIAYEVLAAGGSVNKVCKELGIGLSKLNQLVDISEEFKTAIEAGKAASITRWEEMGEANLENKVFNDKIWKHLLMTRSEAKDPSRVVLNIDSASNAQQVADIVASLEKAGI